MEAVWAIGGLIGGIAIMWFASRQGAKSFETRLQDLKEQQAKSDTLLQSERAKLEQSQADLLTTHAKTEALEAMLREREEAHAQRLLDYQKAEQQLKDSFKALSSDALKDSTDQILKQGAKLLEQFSDTAKNDDEVRKKDIDHLLKPVKENLELLEKRNHEMELLRQGAYKELVEQVSSLKNQQAGLTKETNRLVKALQDPGSAGAWGEMVLERVVEMAGLDGHWSYLTQTAIQTEEGRQIPDMVIQLPANRSLVIDSKAPMRSYLAALESEDDGIRDSLLTDHSSKLFKHAQELKRRDYSRIVQTAPDFTILFVPSESAYRAAVDKRPTLFEEANEFNVLIVTPMSLLPLLKAVAFGWQQEKLAESARRLQIDATTLYERLCTMVESYTKLGKNLNVAVKAYNEMGGSLDARVFPAARKFKEHGIQSNKDLAAIEPIEFAPRSLTSLESVPVLSLDSHEINET